MRVSRYLASRTRAGAASFTTLLALLSAALLVTFVAGAAAATPVPLGTATTFAVLAGAGITSTGATTLNGDVGTFPTASITGSPTVNGTTHAGDAVAAQAQVDLAIAYANAAAQPMTSSITADLGGQTLAPGVYNSGSAIGLTGALSLDAGGNSSAVFVFQVGSTLTVAASSSVNLVNGAQSCNVFWQVGSSASLGTDSSFRGTIMALASITATAGATVDGRLLARTGEVTLISNTVTTPTCTTAVVLRSFSASRTASGAWLRWRTASETRTLGFNVYREQAGRRVKLNRTLLRSVTSGRTGGGTHSFLDRNAPSARLTYKLEAVGVDGSRRWLATAVAARLSA